MRSDGQIRGQCPMGCGETLLIGPTGYVTCSLISCPNPTALATILDERESEHIVKLEHDRFSVQHPLRERVEGELFDCGLPAYLSGLGGPPREPGRYRVTAASGHTRDWIGCHFEALDTA